MGRITKEQKEKNYQVFNDIILDIFLKEGWQSVTYDRISKETGLRKSTLQGYYPANTDFFLGIRDKLKPLLIGMLDFSSKEALLESWNKALDYKSFRYVIDMFISHAIAKDPAPLAQVAIQNFCQQVKKALPNENIREVLALLFGSAVIKRPLANFSYVL